MTDSNSLSTMPKERLRELVAQSPANKRSVVSSALKAAANYSGRTKRDFGRALTLIEAMFDNEWLLGQELNRLFGAGTMKRGGDKANQKNSVCYSDFGVSDVHGKLVRDIQGKMTQEELRDWVSTNTDSEKRVLPKLWGLHKTAHVSNNSGEHEWYTPLEIIEAARRVMGGIDLDPASSAVAQSTVQATEYYTVDDNGLDYEWTGAVWLNPPYAQPLVSQFCAKLCEHLDSGDVTQACVLVNNATETEWFHDVASRSSMICFPKGRVRFLDPAGESGAPLQGQAVLYCGRRMKSFCREFSEFGFCVARI